MKPAVALPLVVALVCALGAPAAAQPPAAPSADALFTSGKAAMDRGDLVAACHDLAESQRLDPAAGTLLNLGECEARSGKLATALAHFREGRAGLPVADFRIPFADERIAALSKRAPRLAVEVSGDRPAGARVTLDGVEVPPTSLGVPVPVDPGTHVAVLAGEGAQPLTVSVVLAEGDSKTVALAQAPAPAARAAAPPMETSAAGGSQRFAGEVSLWTGAAAIVLGSVLGVTAKVTYDSASSPSHCPSGPSSCDAAGVSGGGTAQTEATAATVLFAAGALAAATGAVLYFTAPAEHRVGIVPAVTRQSAGLSLQGAF
jgi:hypothetical protein